VAEGEGHIFDKLYQLFSHTSLNTVIELVDLFFVECVLRASTLRTTKNINKNIHIIIIIRSSRTQTQHKYCVNRHGKKCTKLQHD